MAFLRFSRDKRGYELFALVQPTTNRRGATRQRVLYAYRTPPDVKVGREPFDDAVRRALEARYPDVAFDWRKILETPIPSNDAERWRERRRAERAARQAEKAEAAADAETPADVELPAQTRDAARAESVASGTAAPGDPASTVGDAPGTAATVASPGDATRRRRRRRRGRRGRPEGAIAAAGTAAPASEAAGESRDAAPADDPGDSESGDTPIESSGE